MNITMGDSMEAMGDAGAKFELVEVKQEPIDMDEIQRQIESGNVSEVSLQEESGLDPACRVSLSDYIQVKLHSTLSGDVSTCEVCQADFSGKVKLQTHKLCHFNTVHVCYVCDTYFASSDLMIMHMNSVHKDLNPSSHTSSHEREMFICLICLQRFSSSKTLIVHQHSHTQRDSNAFGCKICGLDFIGHRALSAHLHSPRHMEMKVKISNIFVCVDCRSIFASRDSYAMHMMVRAQQEGCKGGKTNLEATTMIQMMSPVGAENTSEASHARVSEVEVHLDSGCASATPTSNGLPLNLTYKSMSHNQGKFVCVKCGTAFMTQDSLAMHMMLHAKGDLIFSLPATDNSLTEASANGHASRPSSVPVTSKERNAGYPLVCCKCWVPFDTRDQLAMHMMDVHANDIEADSEVSSQSGRHSDPLPLNQSTHARNKGDKMALEIQRKISLLSADSQQSFSVGQRSPAAMKRRATSVEGEESTVVKAKNGRASVDSSYSNVLLYCGTCQQVFSKKETLAEHIHHTGHLYTSQTNCEACNMVFLDTYALSCHMRSSAHRFRVQNRYRCHICGKLMKTFNMLEIIEHMKIHRQNGISSSTAEVHADTTIGLPQVGDKNQSERSHVREVDTPMESSDSGVSGSEPLNLVCGMKVEGQQHVSPGCTAVQNQHRWSQESVSSESSILGKKIPGVKKRKQDLSNLQMLEPRSSTGQDNSSLMSADTESDSTLLLQEGDGPEDHGVQDFVMANMKNLSMCKYCKIIYADKTVYHLHMGLHNLNNPWQCNLCGKACDGLHQFASHVIHY